MKERRQHCHEGSCETGSLKRALAGELALSGRFKRSGGSGFTVALSRMALAVVLLALCCVGTAGKAEAHATSTSYLIVQESQRGDINATWDVAVADVHWALGLDADGDGTITWHEVESRREEIAAFAGNHLEISRGAAKCVATLVDLEVTEHAGEPHLSLPFRSRCASSAVAPLRISATLFFDRDATQRTLIDASTPAGVFTSILSPGTPAWLEPPASSALATFATFTGQGMWHVWVGYDHLAFLLLLLLPGVLRAAGSDWQGRQTVRETATDLLRIVTAFTLAHSITLALAATQTVHVPVRPIEIAIALSIIVAGLLNLFPAAAQARLALAFGFGLIHGFGFANALAELGTHGARLIPTLAGFNIGVELAQLSLVLLVLPLLLRARHSRFYAGRFMPAASLAAAMAGAAWVAARVG